MPRDELEKGSALRRAETRAPQGPGGLATAGDALLEELGLAVAFHDAGRRASSPANVPTSQLVRAARNMHEPHRRAWLLRERPKKHPEGEVGFVGIWSGPNKSHDCRAADRRGLLRRHGDGAHGLPLRQGSPAELEGLPHGRDDRVRLPRPRRQAPSRRSATAVCASSVFFSIACVSRWVAVDGVGAPRDG